MRAWGVLSTAGFGGYSELSSSTIDMVSARWYDAIRCGDRIIVIPILAPYEATGGTMGSVMRPLLRREVACEARDLAESVSGLSGFAPLPTAHGCMGRRGSERNQLTRPPPIESKCVYEIE
jgi:hypothetical protein